MNVLNVSSQNQSWAQLEGTGALRGSRSPSSAPYPPRQHPLFKVPAWNSWYVSEGDLRSWIWDAEKWQRSRPASSFWWDEGLREKELVKVLLGFYDLYQPIIRVRGGKLSEQLAISWDTQALVLLSFVVLKSYNFFFLTQKKIQIMNLCRKALEEQSHTTDLTFEIQSNTFSMSLLKGLLKKY